MARTDATKVASIIEVDANISLTPFIDAANQLVTELCLGAGYTDDRLETIERYLAAHFYTLRDPRPTSETAGPVSASYQSRVDLGLATSHYGQMAMLLDTAGNLASLNTKTKNGAGKRTAKVFWAGKKCDEGE